MLSHSNKPSLHYIRRQSERKKLIGVFGCIKGKFLEPRLKFIREGTAENRLSLRRMREIFLLVPFPSSD